MVAEPIPIELPEVPHLWPVPDLPPVPPGESPILVPGRADQSTWDHVWNWVKHGEQKQQAEAALSSYPWFQQVVKVVEATAGGLVHALGTVVNDLSEYTHDRFSDVVEMLDWSFMHFDDLTHFMQEEIQSLDLDVSHILNDYLPSFYAAFAGIQGMVEDIVGASAQNVEQWAIDNIYDPLQENLGRVTDQLRLDAFANDVLLESHIVNATNALRTDLNNLYAGTLSVVGPLSLAVGALQKFHDECAEPMCSYAGPKTDMGKLLQGLQLAGLLALLMEIGNLNEGDIEDRLREMAGDMGRIVSTFDDVFVGGGGTLFDFGKALL